MSRPWFDVFHAVTGALVERHECRVHAEAGARRLNRRAGAILYRARPMPTNGPSLHAAVFGPDGEKR